MRLRSLIFTLLATLSLSATEPLRQGIFLGVAAGNNSQIQGDIGWAVGREGYTMYGIHAGAIGQSSDEKGANFHKSTGYQVGFLFDVGRAFWAAGYERMTKEDKTTSTNSQTHAVSATVVSTDKSGVYGKVGYKIQDISIYAGYGQYSKGMVGIGWTHHFNF